MGNKRKASIIILSVLIAAFSVCFATYDIINKINSSSNPSVSADSPISIGSKYVYEESYPWEPNTMPSFKADAGVTYMIIFNGSRGEQDEGTAGNGAVCVGFYESDGNVWNNSLIEGGQGYRVDDYDIDEGFNRGGSAFKVKVNKARPNGCSDEWAIAAGGGGGGTNFCGAASSARFIGVDYTVSSGVLGVNGTFERIGIQHRASGADWTFVGYPAYDQKNGARGNSNSSGSSGVFNRQNATGSFNSTNLYVSGGGAGKYEGGGAYVNGDSLKGANNQVGIYKVNGGGFRNYAFAGGGGRCSEGCYPLETEDCSIRFESLWSYTSDCRAIYYRLTPYTSPKGMVANYPTVAKLNVDGDSSYYTPESAFDDWVSNYDNAKEVYNNKFYI
ncbi:MAG: hypothetical protein J5598_03785, partial [Clostridia bacterium]|nr:hypothetical protein [Clostridia bacterium]